MFFYSLSLVTIFLCIINSFSFLVSMHPSNHQHYKSLYMEYLKATNPAANASKEEADKKKFEVFLNKMQNNPALYNTIICEQHGINLCDCQRLS